MSQKFVRVKVRVGRRRDKVLIWTSGGYSVADGQEIRGGRVTKDTELQIIIRAGKVKMKSIAMRETEPHREGNLGRQGMMVLVVCRLVRQKTQGPVHEGGRKVEMFTHQDSMEI